MSDKQAEALQLIEAAISDVHKELGGGFRTTCLGVEMGLRLASEKLEKNITGFRIEFQNEAFSVSSVEFGEEAPQTEGVWAAIYALACPRYTPFGGDPLRIKSITMGFGKNPSIEYDAKYDCGVPLALNRDYNPELLVRK